MRLGRLHIPFLVATIFSYMAAAYGATFSRLPADIGFPQTNISGISQDKSGDIWITSKDCGVYRYDGYHINRIDSEVKASGLFIDSRGRIYVSSPSGTFLYDESLGELSLFSKTGMRDAAENADGDVYFISSNSLFVLRCGCDSLEVESVIDGLRLRSVECVGEKIYLGDASGVLAAFDRDSRRVENVASFPGGIVQLAGHGDDSLWIAHAKKGVSCFSLKSGRVVKSLGKREGLNSDNVQSLCFENDSTLWIGSYEGINVLDLGNGSISSSRFQPFDSASLSHDSVKTIFVDAQGGVWLGTYYGGVCYFHRSRNRFRTFREGLGKQYLNDGVVSCISEAPDSTIWIGTNNGGINEYDRKTGTFKYYRFSSSSSGDGSNDVKAIWCPPDCRVVYVGLFRGGLNVLDRRTGNLRRLNSPRDVISITPEDEDHLMLNSYSGTYLYCISSGEYVDLKKKPSYSRFRNSDIIPGVKIASELNDGDDVVWYSTDNGLYRYAKSSGSLVHYSTSDGLACDFFNPGAACRGKDGTMYFGGVGGVSYFNPSSPGRDYPCPEPAVRSILVNGKPVAITPSRIIRLKSSENHLSFSFSVPDYISVRRNSFEYILEGFEKDWNSSEGRHTVVYPNLPAGLYRFKLRASRGNSEWVECAVHPKIKIYRPWPLSVIGLMIEFTGLLIAIYYVLRSASRRRKMENELALKNLEEKYKREITKLKALKLVNTQLHIGQKPKTVIDTLDKEKELFITRAMSIVESNLSKEDFSTETLAKMLGMSRVSLHNKMKEATGESALEFIHKIRFTEACRLIKEGRLSISEVGYRIGISNPSYFSASFKKVVGCTPKEYADEQNR